MCKHACTPGALDTACKWDAMQVRDRYTDHTCRVHAGTVCAETCCSIADHSVMCEQLDQHMDGRQRPDSCCNSLLHPGVLNACTAQFVTTLGRLCCGWMELDTETPIKLLVRLQPAASKVRKRTARTTTGSSPVRGTRKAATAVINRRFVRRLVRTTAGSSGSPAADPDIHHGNRSVAVVRLGSDCSGYGSEFLALKQCNVNVQTVFCAEIDAGKVKLLKRTHALHQDLDYTLYNDIKTRDCAAAPGCDLFVSGAPCQAFSSAGKGAGLDDLLDRGVTLFHSLDYVRHKRPRVVVIENVRGLTFKKHAGVLTSIVNILRGLTYCVHTRVLNTCNHGIPQNRPRL